MSVRSGPSTALVAVCMGIAFLGVPLLFILCLVASTSGARPLGLFYLALAAIGFVGVPAVVAIDSIRQRNADPTVRVSAERLREFAKDNASTYAPVGHFSAAPGIFLSTHGGSAVDVIMGRPQQTDGYAHARDSEPARLVLGRGLGFLRPMVQAAVVFLVICLVPWIVYSVVA